MTLDSLMAFKSENRLPSQDETYAFRSYAVSLFNTHPGLMYGQHSLESWSDTCKLMEVYNGLPSEAKSPSYSFVKQAFWCMKRPVKSEKLWTQLSQAERELAQIAMAIPCYFDQMELYWGQLSKDDDRELKAQLEYLGVPKEWVAALESWFEHFRADGEFRARVMADIRNGDRLRQIEANFTTLCGFMRLVVYRWRGWSTGVVLKFGQLAHAAARRNLKETQRVSTDLLKPVAELSESAVTLKPGIDDRGGIAVTAYNLIRSTVPTRSPFMDAVRILNGLNPEPHDRFILEEMNQLWLKLSRKYFYLPQT